MRTLATLVLTLCLASASAVPAAAETYDVSTVTCQELTEALNSKSEDDQYGMSVILYWLAGYNQTEEQGTVMDGKAMLKDFEHVADYCAKNPKIGVLTASAKFMGENASPESDELIDLSVIKCEHVLESDKDDEQGLGQILMWLAGYHADVNGDLVFDTEAFSKSAEEIGSYCAQNKQVGFFTTAEKFMAAE